MKKKDLSILSTGGGKPRRTVIKEGVSRQKSEKVPAKGEIIPAPEKADEALKAIQKMKIQQAELEKQVTALRLSKELAEAETEKYRSIFENMEDAYYEASLEGTISEISSSIKIISRGEYTRQDLIGKSLVSFYNNPEDRDTFYNELKNKGSVTDYGISLMNKDGSLVHVSISSRLIEASEGNPGKIIGSIRDISNRKQAEDRIIRLLKNENLLSNVSGRTLHSADLNDFLNDSLAEMGQSLLVSRVYLFEHSYDSNTMNNTHEWCATDIVPQIDELQEIPLDIMPWWVETLQKEQIICYSDIEEIPDSVTKDILRPQNILSILVVPLRTGGKYSGFIGFDDCLHHRIWSKEEVDILYSISRILSGFIEKKQAEAALEQSNDRLNIVNHQLEVRVEERTHELYQLSNLQRAINENAGLAIISTNAKGIIQTFNSAAELMLGYKASEIVGRATPALFHDPAELRIKAEELSQITGEDIMPDFQVFSTLVDLMLTNTTEWNYVRKDKSHFCVKLTVSLFEATDGSIGGYIGVAMDISKEKKVMQSLQESEKLFHSMFHDHAAVMLLVNPETGEIVDANQAAEDYYGYHFRQPVALKISEINALSSEEIQFEMQLALAENRNYFEFPHRLASGQVRTVEVHSTPIEVGGEKLLFSIIHDITVRKLAEQALINNEKTLVQITDNVPVNISLINKNLEFTFTNNAFDEMFHIQPEGCIGKHLRDVIGNQVFERAHPYILQALGGKTVTFENHLDNQDGNKKILQITYTPYYQNNIISGVLTSGMDITERVRADLALVWNEAFLKKMTESSPLAFLVVDNRTDEILFINHQFCDIWGINHLEKAIRNKELTNNDIIPDCLPVLKDVPAFAESCKPLQSEDNRIIVEDEIPFADGRTIRRFSSQIRDQSDQYHGRLYIFEDISRRKNSERLIHIQRDLITRLSATSDLLEALSLTLDSLYHIAEIDAGGIYLFDDATGDLNLIVHKGLSDEFILQKSCYLADSKHVKLVLEAKPVYGRYQPDIFPIIASSDTDQIQSLAVIPIIHEGKVIGSFNLASRTSTSFYANMQTSIESLALQIGGTISRIKAEKALLSSQQNFSLLFDTIDDFMFILDTNGKILKTNSVVGKRLGYTSEELQELHVLEVHPPERRDEAGFIVGEMLAGRALFCPVPLNAKDGAQIPVETRVILGKWDGQDVLFGISRDVTERQRLDAALKMQSAAFESFALPIIITDVKGKIQWANSSFTHLSGYELQEIIGRTSGELINSGRQDKRFFETLWSTIQSGKIWSGEIINKKKDGTLYPEELTITPVLDDAGNIRNFIAIKIDITSRKEMETALRESEERWNFALEGSGDGVWDWNASTDEVFYSHQWKTMLGYADADISNKLTDWDSRMHPDDKVSCYADLNRHFNGETLIYSNEHRMRCKDGSYKWILDRGKVVAWLSAGKPLRVIGTHTDISKRKEFEESLRSAISKEKELNELKSRFVSMASHEFRTPLASILMMSDSLMAYWKQMDDLQIATKLKNIKDQVQHLAKVVTDVMQVSKIQEGKFSFNPQIVDYVALCQVVIQDFNTDALLKNKIHLDTDYTDLLMSLDSRLIVQVLNNLISNAIKYAHPNPIVTVKLFGYKDEILLSISDNGIGIPEINQKNLFQPFYRADNVTQIQGNGLGLNIVRESIMLHGGEITFDSFLGKGSTFVVHLPRNQMIQVEG